MIKGIRNVLVAAALLLPGLLVWAVLASAGTPVHLRVEGANKTYFDKQVNVENCTITDTQGLPHDLSPVAACALAQAGQTDGFILEWVDYGFGLFLQRVGEDLTPDDYSRTWSFWVNDEPASVGLDQYQIQSGDEILLAFSAYPAVPLRVMAPERAAAGENLAVTVAKLVGDYDANYAWHGSWQPAAGVKLHAGEQVAEVPDGGAVALVFDQPQELMIWAEGEGLVRSAKRSLEVEGGSITTPTPSLSPSATPTPTPTPTPTVAQSSPTPSLSPSATPTPAVAAIGQEILKERAGRALNFLRSEQQPDGTIGGSMVSAWSALAFGAAGQSACGVSNNDSPSLCSYLMTAGFEKATDIERLILAARAAGQNPYSFGGNDLTTLLKAKFQNGQLGEDGLINDDIFGVLALVAAGEKVGGKEITGAVHKILNEQKDNGSWGDLDLTAAAIQALQAYAKNGGEIAVNGAVSRARIWLLNSQDEKGGFGANSASTAWVIQAILSLGEDPNHWNLRNGLTPWHALLSYQNNNGGFGWRSAQDVSAFMTAYAATALYKKAWPVVVLPVAKQPLVGAAMSDNESAVVTPVASGIKPGLVSEAKVAGITDEAELPAGGALLDDQINTSPVDELLSSPEPQKNSAAVKQTAKLPINPHASDYTFTLAGFSAANLGIGFFLSRLFVKLW